MDRDERRKSRRDRMWAAAELTDTSGSTEERLRGRRSEAHDELGPDGHQLQLEPVPARPDLGRVRLVMDPALSGRAPFEVLDRVRQVHVVRDDVGLVE